MSFAVAVDQTPPSLLDGEEPAPQLTPDAAPEELAPDAYVTDDQVKMGVAYVCDALATAYGLPELRANKLELELIARPGANAANELVPRIPGGPGALAVVILLAVVGVMVYTRLMAIQRARGHSAAAEVPRPDAGPGEPPAAAVTNPAPAANRRPDHPEDFATGGTVGTGQL